jgi:hypothetical protein
MINTEKTTAMLFQTKQNRFPLRPQFTFKNMDIAYKPELRFLGTYITENLKWDSPPPQVRSLSPKLSKVSCITKSLKEVTSHYMISIYFANFHAL